MNIVDRGLLGSLIVGLMYDIEKCSFHEYMCTLITVVFIWTLLGEVADYISSTGRYHK